MLLKLSGEMFAGDKEWGFDHPTIFQLAVRIAEIHKMGVVLGIVVGGGNIFRGTKDAPPEMDAVARSEECIDLLKQADQIGMLATVMNSLALQSALERLQVETRVMSAIELRSIAESYIKRRSDRHFDKNRVVVFAAGSGNPFFTTDTAAALRASEMKADLLVKATKVDGIYDSDPITNKTARKFSRISYREVLSRDLKVMDATAVAFCSEHDIPIAVVDINAPDVLLHLVNGEEVGTRLDKDR